MSTLFSASGEEVIHRNLEANTASGLSYNNFTQVEETLEEAYEISRCVKWIQKIGAQRVALQFPDELLSDAPDVALAIEKKSKVEVYVLGDTTYGSCCVDEVTAEHVAADSLIHFGRACLSRNQRVPVLYVFAHLTIEKNSFLQLFVNHFPNKSDRILMVADVRYQRSLGKLLLKLSGYSNVILFDLNISEEANGTLEKGYQELQVCGRRCYLPTGEQISDWAVFYVGEEGMTLINLMMNLNSCVFHSYNPKTHVIRRETLGVNQQLRKRYYLIEKTKDANIIGILVATLGMANYLDIIERIKQVIKAAGKKYYTFVVGKPNPAKLANFPEVDVYTLVACPENSLLDSKDFYRPIITPFELEIALNSARQWTGDYTTDFRQLLPGASHYVELESDQAEPDVSLVSGRMRTLGIAEIEPSQLHSNQQVLPRSQSSSLSAVRSGSDFLTQRHWQGLEPHVGETRVTLASTGQRGLASGYQGEGIMTSPAIEPRGKPDGQE